MTDTVSTMPLPDRRIVFVAVAGLLAASAILVPLFNHGADIAVAPHALSARTIYDTLADPCISSIEKDDRFTVNDDGTQFVVAIAEVTRRDGANPSLKVATSTVANGDDIAKPGVFSVTQPWRRPITGETCARGERALNGLTVNLPG